MQTGSYCFGLYAIANATALAYGLDPTQCNYDQMKMRRHFYQCLNEGEMKCFPMKNSSLVRSGGIKSEDIIEVYCHCRLPELKHVSMVECETCTLRIHYVKLQLSNA